MILKAHRLTYSLLGDEHIKLKCTDVIEVMNFHWYFTSSTCD